MSFCAEDSHALLNLANVDRDFRAHTEADHVWIPALRCLEENWALGWSLEDLPRVKTKFFSAEAGLIERKWMDPRLALASLEQPEWAVVEPRAKVRYNMLSQHVIDVRMHFRELTADESCTEHFFQVFGEGLRNTKQNRKLVCSSVVDVWERAFALGGVLGSNMIFLQDLFSSCCRADSDTGHMSRKAIHGVLKEARKARCEPFEVAYVKGYPGSMPWVPPYPQVCFDLGTPELPEESDHESGRMYPTFLFMLEGCPEATGDDVGCTIC